MDRLFASRIERRIAWVILGGAALPIIILTAYAIWQLRAQTLESAESNLKALAKNYGQQIVDRFRFARTELEQRTRLDLDNIIPTYSPPATDALSAQALSLIDELSFRTGATLERTRLVYLAETFHLETPLQHGYAIGSISPTRIFSDMTELPSGIYRCVDIGSVPHSCTASWPGDWIITSWPLYLQGVMGADFNITIWTAQPQRDVLAGLTLAAKLAPAVILLVAILVCGLILYQIRQQLSPLGILHRGAVAIAGGNYDYRVQVATGDEFERLGSAFNDMAANVATSVHTLSSLSTIDQLILSGSDLERVLQEALKLSQAVTNAPVEVILENLSDQSLFRAWWGNSGYEQIELHCSLAEELGREFSNQRNFLLEMEDKTVGALRITGVVTALQTNRLDELAHRLSVAITNLKRSENLYEQANFDSLTGLVNRQALISRLDDSIHIAKRNEHQLALLYLDLDRFKTINDSEGHAAGDALLQLVADRLRSQSREVDTISRLGGDEFAVVITDIKNQNAVTAVVRRLLATLSDQVTLHRIEHTIHASLGIAIYPQDGMDSSTLMRNADTAMYKAKSQGGGGFAFFDPSLHAAAERKVVMQAKLRRAIGTEAVYCEIQPKLHLSSGRLNGAEALMRWRDSELGTVRPDEFIPLAEETGLIHDLTDVLLSEAKKCLSAMGPRESGFRLAINISPRQLALPEFSDELILRAKDHGLSPDQLELEVTESSFVENADTLIANLVALRAVGFTIAMDDFGTGYSSLTLLKTLPLDTLKLDRQFLSGITDDKNSRYLVTKLIEIAKLLGLTVVAEGAENDAELHLLRELGCDYVQGYVIARPLSISNWVIMLQKSSARVNAKDFALLSYTSS